MKRYGVLITFVPGVTEDTAKKALLEMVRAAGGIVEETPARKLGSITFGASPAVQDYDDEYGGPVWYIP